MYRLSENSSSFLDLLRLFAVQLVVIGHGISFCAIVLFLQPPHFVYIQNVAVVLFFILSGFLISYSVYTKKDDDSYSFSKYFIDRFSRIFTGLVPALIFIFCIDLIYMHYFSANYISAGYRAAFDLKTFIGNLFMLQDFPINSLEIASFWKGDSLITSFGTGRPLWTLAIEWWIYMFFGWLILKDRIKINKFLYLLILLVFSIVPLYNLFYGRGHGLFLMWLFGSFTLLLLTRHNERVRKIFKHQWVWAIIGVLGSFGALYIFSWEAYNLLSAMFLCLAILCTVLWLDRSTPSFGKHKKPIHYLASYSYTLYLIHYSVFALMLNLTSMSGVAIFIISFVLSNMFAFLVAYYGEMKYKSVAAYLKKKILKSVPTQSKQSN